VTALTAAIAKDRSAKNTEGLASKLTAMAEAHSALGQHREAAAAVKEAVALLPQESVLFPAARVHIARGDLTAARAVAATLDGLLQTQTRAYAKIVEGEIALQQNRLPEAIDAFQAAGKLHDAWIAHFDLGVAFVRAGHFAEAVLAFDLCLKRRGEAVSIFLDDIPSVRYLAPLDYWHGRAQDGVGMTPSALEKYKAFIALRGDSSDPLAADARKRVSASAGPK
jgi:tetratricopeptide (TPR) repeat protein